MPSKNNFNVNEEIIQVEANLSKMLLKNYYSFTLEELFSLMNESIRTVLNMNLYQPDLVLRSNRDSLLFIPQELLNCQSFSDLYVNKPSEMKSRLNNIFGKGNF